MAKYIKNTSKGVICLGKNNFIPGAESVEVTDEETNHPMIAAYIEAGKLALTETAEGIDAMSTTQLKTYAAEKGIDIGTAKSKADILAIIKTAEAGA
jgi:hypothetical protein